MSMGLVTATRSLSEWLLGRDVGISDGEAMWANLVAEMEDERKIQQRTDSAHIQFLNQRLREARAEIEKLSALRSHEGGNSRTSLETVEGANPSSLTARPPHASHQTSILPGRELSVSIQPTSIERPELHVAASLGKSTQRDPVSIQSNEPQGGTPVEEQRNTALGDSSSSTRKRKRSAQKDPTKFKHQCDVCGERFTRSTTLREHTRTHNNERPHTCSKCPKAFARKKDRNRHEEQHADRKKYKCDVRDGQCGREFAREDGLVAHWRTARGWNCLQRFSGSVWRLTLARYETKFSGRYRCTFTPTACLSEFAEYDAMTKHFMDPANRKCVAEWLIKIILKEYRADYQLQKSFAEESDEEEESAQSQREMSSSQSQDTIQHIQATYQDPSAQIEEPTRPSRAASPLGSGPADNEQEMTTAATRRTAFT